MAAGGSFAWSWNGHADEVPYDLRGPEGAPPVLLLPALSTVSTRAEMAPLAELLADRFRTIVPDWPGFGDRPRPALDPTPDLLRGFLEGFVEHLRERSGAGPPPVVAAGHGAGYALDLAARAPGTIARLVLIAPTWRGPLPTVMGGRRPVQARIRRLVQAPVVGPLIYRLNTLRPVVRRMLAGHVLADPASLTPELLAAKMRVTRQPSARFASAAFVTGGLDPMPDRDAFLEAAAAAGVPILLLYGRDVPPRSRAEMAALAEQPGIETAVLERGTLGMHEELAAELAPRIARFLGEDEAGAAAAADEEAGAGR